MSAHGLFDRLLPADHRPDAREALDLTRSAFAWMAEYEGEIPGASAVECGNYLMMDPIAARAEAAAMLPVLEGLDAEKLHY